MEFRSPTVAAQQNAAAVTYLTKSLKDPAAGRAVVEQLIAELGNATDSYPDWHPILTSPPRDSSRHVASLQDVETYSGLDHTIEFVRGFVTCPYSDEAADQLVSAVSSVPNLSARRLSKPLYSDKACPVVVTAWGVELEADGTIRSRDALRCFVSLLASEAANAQVAETWWNIRSYILGRPHGSRSSLFVNQHTGAHMRKILDVMNDSGIFGPIKESSLDMLSPKKRKAIGETLIRTAVTNWDREAPSFTFELRGETCKASLHDTWEDNEELSVRVEIGKHDLYVSGFYYPAKDEITNVDPRGKRQLAEKFL
ncbi:MULTISPECIES: hypothetical protein [unclassified Brevundimonas]|uniref:hypothetical protein n=1 Tax=unclassified Brevundimonas TaxID=2622653 RepID=UPI000CFB8AFE|nr:MULTISPECIES: hypothetical protein [unclassified Brevundimonas]PQZ82812.1 hypothetical protein CQ026_07375 [Brevundimonas sp. MYb31]PRA30930.1 hypothetical protein CQ024_07505 [Brevundimonas sp. MYb27]PRB16792.1 hypothetical protein CQ039_03835 [Brevundimonas sp. MYb52]PRB34671.1 hypothetical protein CQ035_09895 [Brevundimonas sp. MYb46]